MTDQPTLHGRIEFPIKVTFRIWPDRTEAETDTKAGTVVPPPVLAKMLRELARQVEEGQG